MFIEPNDPDIETIFNRIKNNIYDLQPDFQRDVVWNREKQQKLIDSIMRGWHIPPVHLVKIEGKQMFEVLDGKQRLTSIFNFLTDKFPFNSSFLPNNDDFNDLGGKKYSAFSPDNQKIFLFKKIRIFEVSDIKMNEATELFLRLNLGIVVSASEKRNSIYGPVKNFIRKEMIGEFRDLFNDDVLRFSNFRMAYQDILDRIFFLEYKRDLESKPTSKALEELYFLKSIDTNISDTLIKNLKLFSKVIKDANIELTKSTFISYYWFVREINNLGSFDSEKLKGFIISFENWRDKQRNNLAENTIKVDSSYVEFESYLTKGWLDPDSLKGRHRILISFFRNYSKNNRIEHDKK